MLSISGEGDGLHTTTKRNAHQTEAGDHHRPGRSLGGGRHCAAADGEFLPLAARISSSAAASRLTVVTRSPSWTNAEPNFSPLPKSAKVESPLVPSFKLSIGVDTSQFVYVIEALPLVLLYPNSEGIGRNGQRRARDRAG